jgi:hypothetical protein
LADTSEQRIEALRRLCNIDGGTSLDQVLLFLAAPESNHANALARMQRYMFDCSPEIRNLILRYVDSAKAELGGRALSRMRGVM